MTKSRDTADILEDVKVDGNVTAVGQETLKDNTGAHNTGVGYRAMFNPSMSGSSNVAFGNYNLYANTSGASNTALGYQSLFSNSTASKNTSVGYQSGMFNTTGIDNTFLGSLAGHNNTTGTYNTFVGKDAGLTNTTASSSSYFGEFSGRLATGNSNTFYGQQSGHTVTTGSKNTILGRYTGNQGGLDIRTSSNNIVLSDGDGNPRMRIDSNGDVAFGTDISSNPGYLLKLVAGGTVQLINRTGSDGVAILFQNDGTGVGSISVSGSSTAYNTSSDYRLKENVDYTWDATTRLKQLKPARFNFIADPDTTVDGFLAHEAQAVVPEAVHGTHNEVDDDGVAVMQGIDQSKLVPLLVKTIQELEARITALEA